MNNYKIKQAEKLARYLQNRDKAYQESLTSYEYSSKISNMIPLGQPVLIGHHSEKRHRRDIDRMRNLMTKSILLSEKGDYYSKKVQCILNPKSISSDDPEAVEKLKEKLTLLEKNRIEIKQKVHESWELSNISQNIRQVKLRIEALEKHSEIQEIQENINGVTLKIDKSDNRLKLYFQTIPNIDIRTKLKRNGFKWSPYNQCWQRMISNMAIYVGREIAQCV